MRAGASLVAISTSEPREPEPNTISRRSMPSRTAGSAHTSLPSWRKLNATSGQPSAMRDEECADAREFHARALDELAARRREREQISHDHLRAGRRGACGGRADLDAMRFDARAELRAFGSRRELYRAGGCDARQAFASEAERADAEKLARREKLAGRMASEGEGEIVARDADAVIRHGDGRPAAVGHLDRDRRCAGVEAVLDKLFDD